MNENIFCDKIDISGWCCINVRLLAISLHKELRGTLNFLQNTKRAQSSFENIKCRGLDSGDFIVWEGVGVQNNRPKRANFRNPKPQILCRLKCYNRKWTKSYVQHVAIDNTLTKVGGFLTTLPLSSKPNVIWPQKWFKSFPWTSAVYCLNFIVSIFVWAFGPFQT